MITLNGDNNILPLTITTPHIEERLVRDEQTNDLYFALISTGVLKCKMEMLYVPLKFENGLMKDAVVDARAYVSAVAQFDFDRIKQQAPANIFKIDAPPNFQIQVANGQLEKVLAITTRKFDIRDNTFDEHFVVMKNLSRPLLG